MKLFKYILVLTVAFGAGLYSMDRKTTTNIRRNRQHMLLKQMQENYEYLLLARKLSRSAQPNIDKAISKLETNLKESIKLNMDPFTCIPYSKHPLSLVDISIEIDCPDYIRKYNQKYPTYLTSLDPSQKTQLLQAIKNRKQATKT